MRSVRWADEADADFDRYSAWIWREAAPSDADAWLGAVIDWIEQLADFPRLGTPRGDLAEGVRTRAFRKSVVIAYAIDPQGGVTILRLFGHGRDITAADFHAPA